jgi:hypothetical protein
LDLNLIQTQNRNRYNYVVKNIARNPEQDAVVIQVRVAKANLQENLRKL